MENFINIALTSVAIMTGMTVVLVVHEAGHYIVARFIMKEPNAKITMGFFGKTIFDSKRLKVRAFFFWGGYVEGFSDGEGKKSHMIMFFAAGAFFMILMGVLLSLYLSGGNINIGNLINVQGLLPTAPFRENLFSRPELSQSTGFIVPWLSFETPLDFFNGFLVFIWNMNRFIMVFIVIPYFYPLRGSGKWHWNPSVGMWILKYIFNKVSEKDTANAMSVVGERKGEKGE